MMPWRLVGLIGGPVLAALIFFLGVQQLNAFSKRQYQAGWDANEALWQTRTASANAKALQTTVQRNENANEATLAYVRDVASREPRIVAVKQKETIYVKSPAGAAVCHTADGVRVLDDNRAALGYPAPGDTDSAATGATVPVAP